MIIIDTEGEAFVRENAFDIAVPIHVEQNSGETKIFSYPTVAQLCEEYEKRFAEDLFSDKALDFLREGCKTFCKERKRYHGSFKEMRRVYQEGM